MYQTDKKAILLATYNGEKYITEQIESIRRQTDQDWVLYIHDDGSTDATADIIREYENQYPERIRIVEGAPTGSAKNNFFYLIGQVEAPYYLCCDQDDVWLPNKIEITTQAMHAIEQDGAPCLIFTELRVVDERLNVVAEKMSSYQGLDCEHVTFNRLLIQNVVTGCTTMINRRLRDEMIRLHDCTDALMHDWWAPLIASKYGNIHFVTEPTILYRQHGTNSVGAQNANTVSYMLKRLRQGGKIKESLKNTRKQAALFASVYESGQHSVAYEYGNLAKKNKFARLMFYKKHDIRKSTLAKNLGLLIWG